MLRLLVAPARAGGRSVFSLVTASFGLFAKLMERVLGGQLISDLSGFVGALDNMFGGFRDRAEQTYRILQAPETAFLVVAAPEPDAVREADYFAGRLAADRMPMAGLVVNRVHEVHAPAVDAERALAAADGLDGEDPVAAGVLRVHARLVAQVAREGEMTRRFRSAHPTVPVATVAAQPADVHDIDGLREIGAALAAGRS